MTEHAFGLAPATVAQMCLVFAAHPGVARVLVYGSRAKGNYRPNSDIDLTVEGSLSLSELMQIETELDDLLLPYRIDLSRLSDIADAAVLDHIQRGGLVFYSRPPP